MADARQRAKDRRTKSRRFHLTRIHTAHGDIEKLEAAFGLLRADLVNTSNAATAHRIAEETLAHLLAQSERIPRSVS